MATALDYLSVISVASHVEIFKTDVANEAQAAALVRLLESQFAGVRVNVDLHDADKVLRVEGRLLETVRIVQVVSSAGFYCRLIE